MRTSVSMVDTQASEMDDFTTLGLSRGDAVRVLEIVRSSSEARLGADSCSRVGYMRHVVLPGLAQGSEQRRAAGRPGA